MKKIGLLSDTHGDLDPKIFHYFRDVDEIWHAGDVGSVEVIDKLRAFKPLRGVYGNIDDQKVRAELPLFDVFNCEDVKVLITHIAGRPGKYTPNAYPLIQEHRPQLFVCGHSHILLVQKDPRFNMLWMNPGACGNKGFHKVKTLLRFEIDGDKIQNLEAIETGARS
ncbi:MAG: metallophosphoesterase family protein [Flavobacteriia bacterium]|nr:metallophosphoesterase family protein [Flavobacteriia bacterium]OJX35035.1 MAG: YfcE family phosphodiesterase [Flavobacteriia bacterium 40-80]